MLFSKRCEIFFSFRVWSWWAPQILFYDDANGSTDGGGGWNSDVDTLRLRRKIRTNRVLCTKITFSPRVFCHVKVLSRSCLPIIFYQWMRPFKWGTEWSFISRGIRIITSQSQKLQESALLLSKFKSVKVWPLVAQVPIDEKLHAVPFERSH